MSDTPGEVTLLLRQLSKGNSEAADLLWPIVYSELRRLARRRMRLERKDHTLQPTALVNEAFIKLVNQRPGATWEDRQHFFAVCANAMRQILVDHARRRLRGKRGGKGTAFGRLRLDEVLEIGITPELSVDILALHEALERLEKLEPRQAQVLEYRFFGGLSEAATASLLGISPTTAKRDLRIAKAWLYGEMRLGHGS